jgi:transposase
MVVVMDNLAAHKIAAIGQAIEEAKCRLIYLPPYSPDFSPIENIWSKVKQSLRSRAARVIRIVIDICAQFGAC